MFQFCVIFNIYILTFGDRLRSGKSLPGLLYIIILFPWIFLTCVFRIRRSAEDLFECSSCSIFCSMTETNRSTNVINHMILNLLGNVCGVKTSKCSQISVMLLWASFHILLNYLLH